MTSPPSPPEPPTGLAAPLSPRAGARNIVLAVVAVVGGLAGLVGFRKLVLEAYYLPSPAMYPTLWVRDRLFVKHYAYRRDPPARGDVVLFEFPPDPTKDFIGRVIAIGGDTVWVRGHTIEVNGEPLPRCTIGPFSGQDGQGQLVLERNGAHRYLTLESPAEDAESTEGAVNCVAQPCTVPAGHLFTMGDNRDNSYDGRYWGFVPVALVRGSAGWVYQARGPSYRAGLDANGEPAVPPENRSNVSACGPGW